MRKNFSVNPVRRAAQILTLGVLALSGFAATVSAQIGKVIVSDPKGAGYILFAPQSTTNSYLIDKQGNILHMWPGQNPPAYSVYLMPNGDLLRCEVVASDTDCGWPGGRMVLYDLNGNVRWSYVLNTDTAHQSHDIYPLPNGNVLVDTWDWITPAEAAAAGRTVTTNGFWSGSLVELKPDLASKSAAPIWTWRFWDHIDTTGTNAATLNVNFVGTPMPKCSGSDWIHLNAVVYNPVLDQIILSSRNLNEVYIIEHTTNSAVSAGHSGGKYGKGGDFLYRWGNPQAYGRSGVSNQQLFGQHSPYWIHENGNQVMINNDGWRENGPCTTSAVIIDLPGKDGVYTLPTDAPYGPAKPSYDYHAPKKFWSCIEGSARRLDNGDTLMCASFPDHKPQSIFYEVRGKKVVWEYQLTRETAFRCRQYDSAFVERIFGSPSTRSKADR